ncbi:MAG: PAS domain-containing protein [Burkholderiales bacterium]|nr:PAS domain-containing protein [Burkholderiales bacterium]
MDRFAQSTSHADGVGLKGVKTRQRISTRLTVLIIAFSSAITLIISIFQLIADYRHQRDNLNATIEQIGIFIPNISSSVWSFDQKQILLALEALVQLPNVEQVTVTTSAPERKWIAGRTPPSHIVTRIFPLTHRVGAQEEIIGTLKVVGNLGAIYASVAEHAVSILVSNGLKTFLVAIFMLAVFRRLVTDRLEELAQNVVGLAPQVLRAPQPTGREPHCRGSEDDELDILKCAFDDMKQQLKAAVDELRDSRHLLQSIIDNAIAVIFVKDLQGRYILVNRRFKELFHIEGDELIGRTSYDLFPREQADALHATDQTVLQSGHAMQSEEMIPHEDGMHTYIAIRAPLLDEQGKAHALCMVATDITERKLAEDELKRHRNHLEDMVKDRTAELAQANARQQAELAERRRTEEALRASEQFLDSIVENIPNMIFVKEARELRFVRFNKAGEDLVGYMRQELIGKNDYDFFPEKDADFFTTKDRIVLNSKELLDIPEETLRTRTQGERILHTKKLAILDNQGNPQYLLGISEDITQRKHLEDLVQQRNAELVIAKEQADAANQAKTAFLASMSHELRTPLNAILGYAQILKRDRALNERQAAGLNTIQQSGEHLLTLINDVLDLSKIEAGKLSLYPNAFNLPAFLQIICAIIRVKAEQKSLSFSLDVGPDLPAAVRADEKRLRQVLLNLLGNAVKFTDHGEVILHVRRLACSESEARLSFEVEDSGSGIEADQLEAIFQPFEQVGEVQRRYGGTGLGLAISRQLVRLMGSDIEVDSKVGRGSRFWFEVTVPIEAGLVAPVTAQTIVGYAGSRKAIMIADDVAENRSMLVDLLQSLGFDTADAINGESALQQAIESAPDLIIMDMVMPVMDGLEATRQLRSVPALQVIPVIAVSASATPEDQAASLAAGANAFLAKPIEQAALLQRIGELLKLEWLVETPPPTFAAANGAAPLVMPPQEEMAHLHQLALVGNMRAIREWASQLAARDRRYGPFADKLSDLATRYQSKSILELVEEHRHNPASA